jgi:putative lipoic acid-binding regulatory protein
MSGDTPRRAPSREAILAVHQFPGEFVIKAFGPGTDDFHDAVVAAAHAEVGSERVQVQVRSTTSGTRRCVTLTLMAETIEQVEGVYGRLYLVEELFLIL